MPGCGAGWDAFLPTVWTPGGCRGQSDRLQRRHVAGVTNGDAQPRLSDPVSGDHRPRGRDDIDHVTAEFLNEGWAMEARLDQEANLRVTAMKDDLAFQLQTGNMSRAPYDLLKMQYLCTSGKIQAAAIALPTVKAAKQMGDNLANAERVIRELRLFQKVITVPVLVVAFE